jgi:hypothetical protein
MAKRIVLIDDVVGIVPLPNTGASTGNVLIYNATTGINWASVVSSITGTTNQIIASASTGAVQLSLPQSIGTGSSPTFAGLTVNGSGSSRISFSSNAELRPASDNAIRIVPNAGTTAYLWVASGAAAAGNDLWVRGGGTSNATGKGGALFLTGGVGTGASTNGGDLYLRGGTVSGTGTLGIVYIGRSSSATAGASAIDIGHSSITTTVYGTLVATTASVTDLTNVSSISLASTALLFKGGGSVVQLKGDSYKTLWLQAGDNPDVGGTGRSAYLYGGAASGAGSVGGQVFIDAGQAETNGPLYLGTQYASAITIGNGDNATGPITTLYGRVQFFQSQALALHRIDMDSTLDINGSNPTIRTTSGQNLTVAGSDTDPGNLTLRGGDTTVAGFPGGDVTLRGGNASGSGSDADGGDVTIQGGTAGSSGTVGTVFIGRTNAQNNIYGVTVFSQSATISQINMPFSQSANRLLLSPAQLGYTSSIRLADNASALEIYASRATSKREGGSLSITAGASDYTSNPAEPPIGGAAYFRAGSAAEATGSLGGAAYFEGGTAFGINSTGGNAYFRGGAASGDNGSTGGSTYLVGGNGGSGAGSARGGDTYVYGGECTAPLTSTGGDVYIEGGYGEDTSGRVFIRGNRLNSAGQQGPLSNIVIGDIRTNQVLIGGAQTVVSLLGEPIAPTPLTIENNTRIATTAYVKNQGYLTSSAASLTYAPRASPTFTGTVTLTNLKATADTVTLSATTGAALRLAIAAPLIIQPLDSTISTSNSVLLSGGDNIFGAGGGTGGYVSISGGAGRSLNGNGGDVYIEGGSKTGTGTAGVISIGTTNTTSMVRIGYSGITTRITGPIQVMDYIANATLYLGGVTGNTIAPFARNYPDIGYPLTIRGDDSNAGPAGELVLRGGNSTAGVGGAANLFGGNGTTDGGSVVVQAGNGALAGADTYIIGGQCQTGTDTKGGDVYINAGGRRGTGTIGRVRIANSNGNVEIGRTGSTTTFNGDISLAAGATLTLPTLTATTSVATDLLKSNTGSTIYVNDAVASASVTIEAGYKLGYGKGLTIRGGLPSGTAQVGGDATLSGGSAYLNGTGNGGDAYVIGGSKNGGSGANGVVYIGTSSTRELNLGTTGIITAIYGNVSIISKLAVSQLQVGTEGHVLKVVSGVAAWAPASTGTVTSITLATGSTGLTVAGGTSQEITTSGTFTLAGTLAVGNGGTGVSTTSQSFVFAGPASGSGTPSFRPLSAADVTGISGTYAPLASPTFTGTVTLPLTTAGYVKTTSGGVISSSASVATGDLSGQVSLANGGTNANLTASNGQVVYSTATELALTSGGSTGQVLKYNSGSAPTWGDVTVPAQPYDLRGKFIGTPASGIVLDTFIADRSATISTTNTNHKFSVKTLPSTGSVVLTVQRTRTTLGVPSTVTVFTATSASTDTILNGYYPMTVGSVANNDILADDVIEVVVQSGAVNASFSTPVWTICATA